MFLDVEDLLDISRLEEYVKASDVLVCFLSGSVDLNALEQRSDYFRSASCLRELRAGAAARKPMIFVLEIDTRHGGVPLEVHRRDCPKELRAHRHTRLLFPPSRLPFSSSILPLPCPRAAGAPYGLRPAQELRVLIDEHPVVPWFRAGSLQQVSLRQILQRVLGMGFGEIFIPGEVMRQPCALTPPPGGARFHLYVHRDNDGAAEAAALLAAEASRATTESMSRGRKCHPLLITSNPEEQEQAAKMLLYLNDNIERTWALLQDEVEAALRERGPSSLLLLHEQREGDDPPPNCHARFSPLVFLHLFLPLLHCRHSSSPPGQC